VFAADVEGVDDVALARADTGGSALASTSEDGAFAVELVPTAESGFNDDQVLVGDPELGLSGDDLAILELGGFVLMQAELGVANALFGVDVSGVGLKVSGEEVLRLLIVPVGEGFARRQKFTRNWLLRCADSDDCR